MFFAAPRARRYMRPGIRVVLLAALLCGVTAARGQDPQPEPIFRTKVDLVRVDVTVTGRNGEPVADLQPSDFEVEEDGVPVRVETLQFVRLDGTRTSDTDESLEIRSPEHAAREAAREDVRLFAIFLDDYHVDKSPQMTTISRRTLRELVEKFGPNDLVAVVDPLTPLSHVKFTRSRDELLVRMEAFEGRRGEVFPVRSVMEEAQLRERNIWEIRGGVSLSALGAIVTHLGGLREGRKSVIFFSQGPPLGRLGGPNEDRLEEVLEAANRGNVTIHVIDPRPLGRAPLGGTDSLFRLYNETGGRAIINSNLPAASLGGIITDASAYYLLGYTPLRAFADGKFHQIDVRVKRRGLRVTARKGYWAPTEKELTAAPAPPAEPGLAEALSQLADPRSARAVEVWIGTSRGTDGRTRVSVTWDQASGGERRTDAARLVVQRVTGSNGSGSAEDRRVIGPAAAKDAALASFDVEGGTELQLRFTAETADGEIADQWDHALRVPAFDGAQLDLSTPRFLRTRSAFEAQAMRAGQDPPPAASRQFRPTDRVVVEVECYAPADAVLTLSAQLLNGQGKALTNLPIPPPIDGKSRLNLPLSSLAPSTYVLRVDARAGDKDVQQRSAFRVVP
jgi:VWFA-related protein